MNAFYFLMVLGFTYFFKKEHFLDLCTNNFSFRGVGVYQSTISAHKASYSQGFRVLPIIV